MSLDLNARQSEWATSLALTTVVQYFGLLFGINYYARLLWPKVKLLVPGAHAARFLYLQWIVSQPRVKSVNTNSRSLAIHFCSFYRKGSRCQCERNKVILRCAQISRSLFVNHSFIWEQCTLARYFNYMSVFTRNSSQRTMHITSCQIFLGGLFWEVQAKWTYSHLIYERG